MWSALWKRGTSDKKKKISSGCFKLCEWHNNGRYVRTVNKSQDRLKSLEFSLFKPFKICL